MSRQPKEPFIFLFKKVQQNPLVWDAPFSKFQAWAWMLMQAAHKADGSLERGELLAPRQHLVKTWGRPWAWIRYFLEKLCTGEDPMISMRCIPTCAFQHKSQHKSQHKRAPKLRIVKILNFDNYQCISWEPSAQVTAQVYSRATAPSLSNIKVRTRKKNIPDSDESASPNSQVYNFYVKKKQEIHSRPEWLPTANQAKQLRANIKALLEQGYKPQELTSWLGIFFEDPAMKEKGWPWRFFMNDPIQWSKAKEAQGQPTPVYYKRLA